MEYPRVSIIILNWNGWKDTIECLESLYGVTYNNYDIVVVDNGSSDDSIKKINDYCKGELKVKSKFFKYNPENKPLTVLEYKNKELDEIKTQKFNNSSNNKLFLIKNDKNYGFADGNNIGIKFALNYLNSDYVLLLNNDTAVDKDFINDLVKVAGTDDKIGIVGPKIYSYDRPDEIQSTGFKIKWSIGEIVSMGHTEKDGGQYDEIKSMDCVSGCVMLIKKEVILKLGDFLDHDYFLYYEDMDSCVRTKKLGYDIIYDYKSKIWHKTSSTSKKSSHTAGFYIARNVFIFMKKYASRKQYSSFLLYFFLYKLWYSIGVNTVYYKDLKAFIPFFKGVRQGLKWKNSY